MALNLFKKQAKEKVRKSEPKKAEQEPAEVSVAPQAPKLQTTFPAWIPDVLLVPHITEKSTAGGARNEYVFRVPLRATKSQVRQAVGQVYGVQVMDVRTVRVHEKKIRLGRTEGIKPGYKKAIVRIEEGQTIEVLPK